MIREPGPRIAWKAHPLLPRLDGGRCVGLLAGVKGHTNSIRGTSCPDWWEGCWNTSGVQVGRGSLWLQHPGGHGPMGCPQEQSGSTFSWPRVGGVWLVPEAFWGGRSLGLHWSQCRHMEGCVPSPLSGLLTPQHGDGVHRLERKRRVPIVLLGLREGWLEISNCDTGETLRTGLVPRQMRGLQSCASPSTPNLL